MKRLFFAMTLAAVLFCGCDEMEGYLSDGSSDELLDEATLEVSFSPAVVPASRVTSDVFDIYDEILVNAVDSATGSTFASNVAYSYRNGIFSSETPITYTSSSQKLMFFAVYPATIELDNSFTFSVMADQSSGDNYEMSDLLLSATTYTSDNCPYLDFYHAMSSIVVDITTPGAENGVLKIYAKGTAQVDVDSFSRTATGEAVEIIAASNGDASYKVILAPQTISAGELMATYEVEGQVYEWALENTKEYAAGCRYYVEWDLEEDQVSFTSYINGWEDGDAESDNDGGYGDYDDELTNKSLFFEYNLTSTYEAAKVNIVFDYAPEMYYSDTSTIGYNLIIPDDASWVTVPSVYDDLSGIFIELSENPYSDTRSTQVILEYMTVSDDGTLIEVIQYISIVQFGVSSSSDEYYDISSPLAVEFAADGGVVYLDITEYAANTYDIAIGVNDDSYWFSVETDVSSADSLSLVVMAEANDTGKDREGYFTFITSDGMEFYVSVCQDGGDIDTSITK